MSIEEDFCDELLDAVNNDRLTLPTLPEVALKIRDAVNHADVSAGGLSDVIASDVAMSARLIKVANSPLLRGRVVVDNLQMAITRLGITFVRNLATGLAMEQMFQATSDVIDKRLRASWEHSLEVGSIAHVLAHHFGRLKPDQATLAGLTSEIGILPILTMAEESPELLDNEEILDGIIDRYHTKIGSAILRSWDFPEELALVPEAYMDFGRDSMDGPDYGDLVTVANLQSRIGSNHPLTQIDWSTIPAFDKLGMSHEVDMNEAEEFQEEVAGAKMMLV